MHQRLQYPVTPTGADFHRLEGPPRDHSAILAEIYEYASNGGIPPLSTFVELLNVPHDNIMEYVPPKYLVSWYPHISRAKIYRLLKRDAVESVILGGVKFYNFRQFHKQFANTRG